MEWQFRNSQADQHPNINSSTDKPWQMTAKAAAHARPETSTHLHTTHDLWISSDSEPLQTIWHTPTLFSISLSLPLSLWWDMLVYLLVDADSEDIAVPQRLPTKDQAVVEFLYRLIPLSGSVGVRQTDQFSAARMQLSRHLRTGGAVHDTESCFATVESRLWATRHWLWVYLSA